MINKLLNFLRSLKKNQAEIKKLQYKNLSTSNEILWSSIFHDSIRDKEPLQKLSLNIGRWAGGYPFFYILNRILSVKKPETILEFGLGESSKFISTYLDYYLPDSSHLIIEQDEQWKLTFEKQFILNERSRIEVLPLVQKEVYSYQVNSYDNILEKVEGKFHLYIVDGPFGSPRFSRYDIMLLAERLESSDDFIIIIDDTNRKGELDTVNEIETLFNKKGITFFKGDYSGDKTSTLIVSSNNKYFLSL